jgi:hypothetical protein
VARQILLVVSGQLAGVVGLPTHRELGDVGHHPAASLLPVVGASERAPGALLSSEMVWDESRPEASVRTAITRSKRKWIFLGEKRSAIVGSRGMARAVDG